MRSMVSVSAMVMVSLSEKKERPRRRVRGAAGWMEMVSRAVLVPVVRLEARGQRFVGGLDEPFRGEVGVTLSHAQLAMA